MVDRFHAAFRHLLPPHLSSPHFTLLSRETELDVRKNAILHLLSLFPHFSVVLKED